jgi:hypothetical protein
VRGAAGNSRSYRDRLPLPPAAPDIAGLARELKLTHTRTPTPPSSFFNLARGGFAMLSGTFELADDICPISDDLLGFGLD